VPLAPEALGYWKEAYERLTANRLGLLGALTARAEAHTVRLALVYALLNLSNEITRAHIESAVAVWDYCDASVQYPFGGKLGHPIADPT
jgi:DNA replicative helicase MCM subunit Mcm2 (Cdc46/Mcm family)